MRVFPFWDERGQLKLFKFSFMNFYNQKERKDVMGVSSCNSVNSTLMYNMEIKIKMSFVIALIATAIIIITFDCFQMSC